MSKTLTIIIPTYNMEKYLRGCLSSLLIGDGQDRLEVLVVNDGSKDASLQIGREFESRYPETFRVIDKSNGNYGSCINRGLAEATGTYVKVLDADDSYNTQALHDLLIYLDTATVDAVVSDYVIVDEHGHEGRLHTRQLPTDHAICAEKLFTSAMNDIVKMHEITYRTDNLRRINYRQTEGISYTDQEWIFLPMTTVRTVQYLKKTVYRYLVGRAGQTVDPAVKTRSQKQAETVIFSLVDKYNSCEKINKTLQDYLTAIVVLDINLTYRSYLVYLYKYLPSEDLRLFDDRLKQANGELYAMMDNEKVHSRIPLRFVHSWRQGQGSVSLSLRAYRSLLYPILKTFNLA